MPEDRPLDLERLLGVIERRVDERCLVAPSPELGERIKAEAERINNLQRTRQVGLRAALRAPKRPGFNDGLIVPGSYFPLGTSIETVRSAAAQRAPLHGTRQRRRGARRLRRPAMSQSAAALRGSVLLDRRAADRQRARSTSARSPTGWSTSSARWSGPYRLPQTLAEYANGNFGIGSAAPNARTWRKTPRSLPTPPSTSAPYDNDGNGFVDAFIVVHAGQGGEQTGNSGDIWSHKWMLPSAAHAPTARRSSPI